MSADVQSAFRALADPTRRQILVDLSRSDLTIGEIVGRFDITRTAVKKHLAVLEAGDLISVQVRGRARVNSMKPAGLKSVSDWIAYFDHFWDQRLDKLSETIMNNQDKGA